MKMISMLLVGVLLFTGCTIYIPEDLYGQDSMSAEELISHLDDIIIEYPDTEKKANTPAFSENSMIAVIDGTQYEFSLVSAKMFGGDIRAEYAAYNPRGEKICGVMLYLDPNIAEGKYSSANGDTEVKIGSGLLRAQSGVTGMLLGSPTTIAEGCGSYEFELTYRSTDWLSYSGSFSAVLGRTGNSGTYGADSMVIENGVFHFTISD